MQASRSRRYFSHVKEYPQSERRKRLKVVHSLLEWYPKQRTRTCIWETIYDGSDIELTVERWMLRTLVHSYDYTYFSLRDMIMAEDDDNNNEETTTTNMDNSAASSSPNEAKQENRKEISSFLLYLGASCSMKVFYMKEDRIEDKELREQVEDKMIQHEKTFGCDISIRLQLFEQQDPHVFSDSDTDILHDPHVNLFLCTHEQANLCLRLAPKSGRSLPWLSPFAANDTKSDHNAYADEYYNRVFFVYPLINIYNSKVRPPSLPVHFDNGPGADINNEEHDDDDDDRKPKRIKVSEQQTSPSSQMANDETSIASSSVSSTSTPSSQDDNLIIESNGARSAEENGGRSNMFSEAESNLIDERNNATEAMDDDHDDSAKEEEEDENSVGTLDSSVDDESETTALEGDSVANQSNSQEVASEFRETSDDGTSYTSTSLTASLTVSSSSSRSDSSSVNELYGDENGVKTQHLVGTISESGTIDALSIHEESNDVAEDNECDLNIAASDVSINDNSIDTSTVGESFGSSESVHNQTRHEASENNESVASSASLSANGSSGSRSSSSSSTGSRSTLQNHTHLPLQTEISVDRIDSSKAISVPTSRDNDDKSLSSRASASSSGSGSNNSASSSGSSSSNNSSSSRGGTSSSTSTMQKPTHVQLQTNETPKAIAVLKSRDSDDKSLSSSASSTSSSSASNSGSGSGSSSKSSIRSSNVTVQSQTQVQLQAGNTIGKIETSKTTWERTSADVVLGDDQSDSNIASASSSNSNSSTNSSNSSSTSNSKDSASFSTSARRSKTQDDMQMDEAIDIIETPKPTAVFSCSDKVLEANRPVTSSTNLSSSNNSSSSSTSDEVLEDDQSVASSASSSSSSSGSNTTSSSGSSTRSSPVNSSSNIFKNETHVQLHTDMTLDKVETPKTISVLASKDEVLEDDQSVASSASSSSSSSNSSTTSSSGSSTTSSPINSSSNILQNETHVQLHTDMTLDKVETPKTKLVLTSNDEVLEDDQSVASSASSSSSSGNSTTSSNGSSTTISRGKSSPSILQNETHVQPDTDMVLDKIETPKTVAVLTSSDEVLEDDQSVSSSASSSSSSSNSSTTSGSGSTRSSPVNSSSFIIQNETHVQLHTDMTLDKIDTARAIIVLPSGDDVLENNESDSSTASSSSNGSSSCTSSSSSSSSGSSSSGSTSSSASASSRQSQVHVHVQLQKDEAVDRLEIPERISVLASTSETGDNWGVILHQASNGVLEETESLPNTDFSTSRDCRSGTSASKSSRSINNRKSSSNESGGPANICDSGCRIQSQVQAEVHINTDELKEAASCTPEVIKSANDESSLTIAIEPCVTQKEDKDSDCSSSTTSSKSSSSSSSASSSKSASSSASSSSASSSSTSLASSSPSVNASNPTEQQAVTMFSKRSPLLSPDREIII